MRSAAQAADASNEKVRAVEKADFTAAANLFINNSFCGLFYRSVNDFTIEIAS